MKMEMKKVENKVNNILRGLSMIEKAFERFLRKNYLKSERHSEILPEIKKNFIRIRSWLIDYRAFAGVSSFNLLLAQSVEELRVMIEGLISDCISGRGKKKKKGVEKNRLNFPNRLIRCSGIF